MDPDGSREEVYDISANVSSYALNFLPTSTDILYQITFRPQGLTEDVVSGLPGASISDYFFVGEILRVSSCSSQLPWAKLIHAELSSIGSALYRN